MLYAIIDDASVMQMHHFVHEPRDTRGVSLYLPVAAQYVSLYASVVHNID